MSEKVYDERIRMTPNGPEVSRLVYGAWRLGEDPPGNEPEHILEKIHTCLDSFTDGTIDRRMENRVSPMP